MLVQRMRTQTWRKQQDDNGSWVVCIDTMCEICVTSSLLLTLFCCTSPAQAGLPLYIIFMVFYIYIVLSCCYNCLRDSDSFHLWAVHFPMSCTSMAHCCCTSNLPQWFQQHPNTNFGHPFAWLLLAVMLNIMKNGVFGLLEAHQLKHLLIDAMNFAEILVQSPQSQLIFTHSCSWHNICTVLSWRPSCTGALLQRVTCVS